MERTIEHLKSLADAIREYWDNTLAGEFIEPSSLALDIETELIRAEDYLEEVERNANTRMEM